MVLPEFSRRSEYLARKGDRSNKSVTPLHLFLTHWSNVMDGSLFYVFTLHGIIKAVVGEIKGVNGRNSCLVDADEIEVP